MANLDSTPKPSNSPPVYALIVATLLLAAYLVMTGVLFYLFSTDNDHHWQHALTIYSGFQAFATAAGGLLLGTTIQQARVNAAEHAATTAKADRDAAQAKVHTARSIATSGALDVAAQLNEVRKALS